MAAIYMSQSAEKWGFNHQFLLIKMICRASCHNLCLCLPTAECHDWDLIYYLTYLHILKK